MGASAKQARETRASILTSARILFEARGYEHVSPREIAEHAGFTNGAVAHSFRTKADLFTAAMGRRPISEFQGAQLFAALRLNAPEVADAMAAGWGW